jgi:hypothetical protein
MRAMLEDLIPTMPAQRSLALKHELDLLRSTVDRAFAVPEDRMRAELPDSQGLGGTKKYSARRVPEQMHTLKPLLAEQKR